MNDNFPIVPAPRRAFFLLYGLGVLLFLIALGLTVLAAVNRQTAPYPVAILLALVSILLFYVAASSQYSFLEVSRDTLRVRRDLFGRRVATSALDLTQARVVNLIESKPLQPKWRLFGAAVPGYLSGWFKLRDGRRALLFVTDQQRVVCVPWRDGRLLLISVEQPEQLLERLSSLT
jgi:hypothetical protein